MKKKRQQAHPESVLLALRALGSSVTDFASVSRALREKQRTLREQTLEPVIVAWEGQVAREQTRLRQSCKTTLILEDGTTLPWPPRKPLPLGYHQLQQEGSPSRAPSLIISAPTAAHFPTSEEISGVFAPLYALHSSRSPDVGDLTEMEALAGWTTARGGQVVSTLPLLASFLAEPFEPSPYSPISRLFWNELYIDPSRVPEFVAPRQPPSSRRSSLVDYKSAMHRKRRLLQTCAASFFQQADTPRRRAFERFVAENPEVRYYGEFRAATDQMACGWHDWPSTLPQRDREMERYHLYAQWLIRTALSDLEGRCRDLGCLLYLDLPLGLHRDSFDSWRYPQLFVKGMSGGAPPDPVFTSGQDWAFQPVHPEKMREDRYRYVIAYIRNHLRYAKLLRIDHVMGLHRLFWIPEGLKGDRGLYVQYPAEEMYAILSLESHRAGAGIVGENLGVVPRAVNAAMRRHNIRQLYVAQYETAVSSRKSVLRNPPAGSVASLNTHDLFPFQGFLDDADIEARVKLKFATRADALKERKYRARVRKALKAAFGQDLFAGCMRFLKRSKASIVLYNLEDLWHETRPQNIPATTREHANWRRRLRYSMDRLKRLKVDLSRKEK
jgi:4-alpha-glucanotransferase